jgi:hypothetical protein
MELPTPNQSSPPPQNLQKIHRELETALADIRRTWPQTYRTFYARTYQLPPNDDPQYPRHAYAFGWDTFITAYILTRHSPGPVPDAGHEASFRSANAWASLGQRTRFLDRELAEALLRTELPEGFGPEDIQWRCNAFRLFLPKGLFSVLTDHGPAEPTCLTAVRFQPGVDIPLADGIQADVHAFAKRSGRRELQPNLVFREDVHELLICLQVRPTPEWKPADIYFSGCLLDERSLTQIAQDSRPMDNGEAFNLSEIDVMNAIKRLTFNVILLMAFLPPDDEPEVPLPGPARMGKEFRPRLVQAKFLGQGLSRSAARLDRGSPESAGRPLSGQWRAGYWRRQAFGEGRLQRKLIWIQPSKTSGPESDA